MKSLLMEAEDHSLIYSRREAQSGYMRQDFIPMQMLHLKTWEFLVGLPPKQEGNNAKTLLIRIL